MAELDYCELFDELRAEISNFNDDVKKLDKLRYWSGNEEHIVELCRRVLGVLQEHELIELVPHAERSNEHIVQAKTGANVNRLRAALVFLIHNTDNGISYEDERLGRRNVHCVHLFNRMPPLRQFVTIAIANKCGLNGPLDEFLACGPLWLTISYYECCNMTLLQLDNSLDILKRMCSIVRAAAQAIGYQANSFEPGPKNTDWPEATATLLRIMAKMLHQHLLTSNTQLSALQRRARNLYLGHAVRQMTDLLVNVLQQSQEPWPAPLAPHHALYVLLSPTRGGGRQRNDPLPVYRGLVELLLNALQRLIEHVTVGTYMYWVEVPAQRPPYNLQQEIGDLAVAALQQLESGHKWGSDGIKQQLQTFVGAAVTFQQLVHGLPLGELLRILDGDLGEMSTEQLTQALDELFSRSIAFGNEECVESIARHVALLEPRHALLILQYMQDAVQAKLMRDQIAVKTEAGEDEEEEEANELSQLSGIRDKVLYAIYEACDEEQKMELLVRRESMALLGHVQFSLEDYWLRRNFFFNNLTCKNLNMDNFLLLCWEQPRRSWLAFSHLAMAHPRYANLFWSVARRCSQHAPRYLGEIVADLAQDDRILMQVNAISFLLSLYNLHISFNSQRLPCQRSVAAPRRRRLPQGRHLVTAVRPRFVLLRRPSLTPLLLPYSAAQLREAQNTFFTGIAAGLAKFSEQLDFTPLQRLLRLFDDLAKAERKLNVRCQEELRRLQRLCGIRRRNGARPAQLGKRDARLAQAKVYVRMHGQYAKWRRSNWALGSALMLTVDKLRWNLGNFGGYRAEVLNLAVRRMMDHIPSNSTEFTSNLNAFIETLEHNSFWCDETAELLSGRDSPITEPQLNLYIELLTQSSAQEARALLFGAMRSDSAGAVMARLAHVVSMEQSRNAVYAYEYLFESFMAVFRQQYMPPSRGQCSEIADNLIGVILKSPPQSLAAILQSASDTIVEIFSNASRNEKWHIMERVDAVPENATTDELQELLQNVNIRY